MSEFSSNVFTDEERMCHIQIIKCDFFSSLYYRLLLEYSPLSSDPKEKLHIKMFDILAGLHPGAVTCPWGKLLLML